MSFLFVTHSQYAKIRWLRRSLKQQLTLLLQIYLIYLDVFVEQWVFI
jgi:hypothetical protein